MSVMGYNFAPTIMCLLILNQTNLISKKHLKNAWDNNSHGGGIAYPYRNDNNEKVVAIEKYQNFDSFYVNYVAIRKSVNKPIILHFRITSSGGRSVDNIHPFFVRENKIAMGHNGTIRSLGDKTMSDSRHLAQIIGSFDGNSVCMLKHSGLRQLINSVIGQSKLAFVDSQGNWDIFNEHLGHWTANGDWMSNDSYLEVRSWVYQGNKKVSKANLRRVNHFGKKTTKTTTEKYEQLAKDYNKKKSESTLFDRWDDDMDSLDSHQFDVETNSWVKI